LLTSVACLPIAATAQIDAKAAALASGVDAAMIDKKSKAGDDSNGCASGVWAAGPRLIGRGNGRMAGASA